MNKKYNIGLDIGTTSVGWAVVEEETQKIMRKGNKKTPLWGVRLFEEANTAEKRRGFRSSRRRYKRRKERIKLLQKEFENEINKVDRDFFTKLEESKFTKDDDINKSIKITFDENKLIKKYYEENPTIYHLRDRLTKSTKKEDIRLIYLAIHHIIKYRGNFNYPGTSLNISSLDIASKFYETVELLIEYYSELEIDDNYREYITSAEIENTFLEKSKNDRKIELKELLNKITSNTTFINEFVKIINGYKFSTIKLFNVELEKDISFGLSDDNIEEKTQELCNCLNDKIDIFNSIKELYEIIYLRNLFSGSKSTTLSSRMIERYNQHQHDLIFIKQLFDNHRAEYNQILRTGKHISKTDKEKACLYDRYVKNHLTNEEFCKELNKLLPVAFENCSVDLSNEYNLDIKSRIENGLFLPRITEADNGKYPYQLNKDELLKIIENQSIYYPFLKEKTIDGTYKIIKLLEFKIPYYVGPLNRNSKFAWLEKKSDAKITPYNFDEVINKEKTAEEFIKRMISHCTYLNDKVDENGNIIEKNYALPNNSILYSKYKVMNELKQIKINGNKIENNI